jgi:hypothetical protein
MPQPLWKSPRPRRLFASLAVLAGVFLLTSEIPGFASGASASAVLWVVVAALLIVLGMLQLLFPAGRR